MRALTTSALIIAALSAQLSAARAQTPPPPTNYSGTPRQRSSADVLAILGKRQALPPPPELLFDVDVQAGASTKVKCGQLGVNVDVAAMARRVAQIPQQLVNTAQALIPAMPMLTLCYASPSLCAEVKNVNFQINERLRGLSDVCRSIDGYIASQSSSDAVRDAAAKRGWEQCIANQQTTTGMSLSEAMEYCNSEQNPTPVLYTDIARSWLQDTVTNQPQNVLASMLDASGQRLASGGEEKYRFLTAVLGELKLDVNGKLLPVFPAHPMTVSSLAKKLSTMAIALTCDQARFGQAVNGLTSTATPAEVRFYEQQLFDVVQEKLSADNVTDLFSLDPPDRDLACNALGRALGKAALRRSAEEGEAITTTALQNPAVLETVRTTFETRAERTFRAMRSESQELVDHSIPELIKMITRMAEIQRATRRATAAAISKAQQDMQDEMSSTPCESDETCD